MTFGISKTPVHIFEATNQIVYTSHHRNLKFYPKINNNDNIQKYPLYCIKYPKLPPIPLYSIQYPKIPSI